jgi:hypothetical protein
LGGERAKEAWKRRSVFRNKQSLRQRFSARHLFTLDTMSRLLKNLFCLWLVYFVFGWCAIAPSPPLSFSRPALPRLSERQ